MSFKAKNLHYEKQEPAFLRKLRGEYGGDRQNVSVARPSKPRLELGEDEDPTIVDESGESMTKEEFEALSRGEKPASDQDAEADSIKTDRDGGDSSTGTSQGKGGKSATIGASNKRKQARVIGDDHEDEPTSRPENPKEDTSKSTSGLKAKSKKKKIKLSFDDDEAS